MKLSNDQLLQIFCAYPNALIKWRDEYLSLEMVDIKEGLLFLKGQEMWIWAKDCQIAVRSLESMTEEEAKEFLDWGLVEQLYQLKLINMLSDGSVSTSQYHWHKNRLTWYYLKSVAIEQARTNKDELRKRNFLTEVNGINLIEAGIAEINNECYT